MSIPAYMHVVVWRGDGSRNSGRRTECTSRLMTALNDAAVSSTTSTSVSARSVASSVRTTPSPSASPPTATLDAMLRIDWLRHVLRACAS